MNSSRPERPESNETDLAFADGYRRILKLTANQPFPPIKRSTYYYRVTIEQLAGLFDFVISRFRGYAIANREFTDSHHSPCSHCPFLSC